MYRGILLSKKNYPSHNTGTAALMNVPNDQSFFVKVLGYYLKFSRKILYVYISNGDDLTASIPY